MKRTSLLLLPILISACSTLPSVQPRQIHSHEEDIYLPPPPPPVPASLNYYASGGPVDPDLTGISEFKMSTPVPFLELSDVSISDLAKLIIVDHAGLGLAMTGDLSARVDWSGGPFSVDDAVRSFEQLVVSHNLSFRRVGEVITVSPKADGGNAISYGYSRVYRSNAASIVTAIGDMFPNVKAASVGRSVTVSGSSADVTDTLRLVRDLDRDTVSSLPWAVVRVSPQIASEAIQIIETLADPSDPLAVRSFSGKTSGVVLLVGYNKASVDEAKAVLLAIAAGEEPKVSRVVLVDDPASADTALKSSFASEIEAKSLTVSVNGRSVVLRGSAASVAAAYEMTQKFGAGLGFVDVQVVVAETLRGSVVDRSVTLSGNKGSLSSGRGGQGGLGLSVGLGGSFRAAVDWLERDTSTKILTTSRLSVRSGGKGDLSVGAQIPIPGQETTNSDGTRTISTEYRDTGVILRVSPQLLSDGRVSVQLEQELSTAGTNAMSGIDAPAFEQRRLVTDLVVDAGELVSAGGLDYQSSDQFEQAPLRINPTGSSTARKLVILLSATPKTSDGRRAQVQDQLSGLADVLSLRGAN